jgi:tetratricopeptide (TPR) repeat protein
MDQSMKKLYRDIRRVFVLAVVSLFSAGIASTQTVNLSFPEILRSAEASTAAKDWKAAARLWQQVVGANPVNGRFWSRLADANYGAKDYLRAIAAYEKELDLRVGFPADAAYNIACCYALLGERENAIKWLEKALDLGYRHLEHAQTDSDLQSIRGDVRFQRLAGLADVSKMSREEGWRYDLGLLQSEVNRKGYAYGITRPISKEDFHAAAKTLSDQVTKLTDPQMVVALMKLLRSLGDGHTGLLAPPQQPDYALALPLQFYFFKEGLFIIASDPKYKNLLGAQVLSLGGHSVDEVTQSLDQVISRDNDMWPVQLGPYHMRNLPLLRGLGLVPDIRKTELSLRDASGRSRTVTVEADSSNPSIWNNFPSTWITYSQSLGTPLPLYLKNTRTNYWFEYLPDSKVLYFQYNRVRNDRQEPLARFAERLFKFIDEREVEKLVIDMRWNNGGNTFLSQPLLYGLIKNEKINQQGKLFVIIGRRTFSAAQNTATFFERHTRALFVGEPTGSSPNFVGEETPLVLPYSKITFNVSDLYWQSSWPEDYRTWIAPQIYTPPTFSAYRDNRDSAMEAILEYK